jgi:Rhs family protein
MGINRTHSFGHSSAMLMLVCAALLLLSVLTGKGLAQGNESPKRGLQAGGAYSLGDIETINQTNGNLMLHLPLASLPAGRGGQSAGLQLLYNSKLYESRVEVVPDHIRPGQWISQNWLFKSDAGGWRYGVGYDLELENRLDQFQNPVPSCTVFRPDTDGTTIGGSSDTRVIYIFKLKMTFPDGSAHEFRPHGHNDDRGDGYFKVRPDGLINGCPNTSQTYNRLTYYSVDGTYLRLDFQPAPGVVWHQTPWTLYYPDGTRVTSREQGALGQRVYDRNNNYIEIQRVTLPNGNPATKLVDQLGRSIMVEFDSPLNQDYIRMTGAGGQDVTWTVKWKTAYVNKTYYTTPQGSLYPQTIRANWRVVDQIILPAQAGALDYTFNYNAAPYDPGTSENVTSYGWGEISSITLPSGAQAAYQYALDGVSGPSTLGNPSYKHVLHNSPTRKDLTYQQEYDGASTPVSETWQYDFGDPFASGFTTSIIIGPDNGLTMVTFGDTSSSSWTSGLVKKIAHPDGRVVEQIWQQNKVDPLRDANPYVKTEATSIRDAGGNLAKTAIKDYNYDKNGNVTQVAEYDWVSYSSAHDASGNLIIPQNAPLKRVIVNSYYSPTPDASDTTTNDPDAYNKPTSPNLKNAIEFSEARSDFSAGSVISRAESFYDNPSTTGNLTTERKWDSIKAGISRPLSAGNSISVTHQYDPYGNRTLTTDANGVQTQFIYDPINGHGNLYVTETKVAVGTPVQQMTTRAYDFHTGLVTQSTDADNNVTNRTTYDVFGRPILVEEADGIAGVEKQTATEHSDTERRVIVRSDLNTTGDGKLITIQHYDQLGRICLTRRLESGNPAEATDKTKGVKIQTRYFAGDAGNPNGYELVSAPYRAATSGAAG